MHPRIFPVSSLLSVHVRGRFNWTTEQLQAFTQAKNILANAVTVRFPRLDLPFELSLLRNNRKVIRRFLWDSFLESSQTLSSTIPPSTSNRLPSEKPSKVICNNRKVIRRFPLGFFPQKLSNAELNHPTFDLELLAIREVILHFSSIIKGHSLIILTDHKNLISASAKRENHSSQARHFSHISEFTSDFRHIPGEQNVVANTLSRFHCDSITQDIAKGQERDDELDQFRTVNSHNLEDTPLPSGETLTTVIEHGLSRPFVPIHLRRQVFDLIHGLCHPSTRSTRKAIVEEYYWPSFSKDINRWCTEYLNYQQAKGTRHVHLPATRITLPAGETLTTVPCSFRPERSPLLLSPRG